MAAVSSAGWTVKIIDSSAGFSRIGFTAKKWGNAFADWKASFSNEFTIKDVRVSLLLDGQKGGDVLTL